MDCFAAKIALPCGGSVVVGGLCESGRSSERTALCQSIHLPAPSLDPVKLDRAMAQMLEGFSGNGVPVVGAAFYHRRHDTILAENGWRSGGVIGVPGSSAESAEGVLEEIEAGLYLYAAPGGPGFAAIASLANARTMADIALSGSRNALLVALHRYAPAGYLCVFDGSGAQARGLLAAGAENQQFCLTLPVFGT